MQAREFLINGSGDIYFKADHDESRAHFMGAILEGTAIPEPSPAALFGLAGFGLVLRPRRRYSPSATVPQRGRAVCCAAFLNWRSLGFKECFPLSLFLQLGFS